NNSVAAVSRQEELKKLYPPEQRLIAYAVSKSPLPLAADPHAEPSKEIERFLIEDDADDELSLVKRAHPDLGRLGVFWHTQGSGKSYSMAFFAEKVRRTTPGNFTFVIMTDREDLDDQIWRTFIGCGVTDEKTPRAASGKDLQEILRGNHRFVFSLNLKGDERTYAHSYPTESRCIVGPMINRERPCLNDMRNGRGVPMKTFDIAVSSVTGFLE